jgi:hypothetical protein
MEGSNDFKNSYGKNRRNAKYLEITIADNQLINKGLSSIIIIINKFAVK